MTKEEYNLPGGNLTGKEVARLEIVRSRAFKSKFGRLREKRRKE